MPHIKKFTDSDSQLLRRLIRDYGMDGLTHELHMLTKTWRAQNAKLYAFLENRASGLAYAARLMMGKAPVLRKVERGKN